LVCTAPEASVAKTDVPFGAILPCFDPSSKRNAGGYDGGFASATPGRLSAA